MASLTRTLLALLVAMVLLAAPALGADATPSAAEPAPTAAGTAQGAADASPTATAAPAAAPDIIFLMVDDLGFIPDERVLERLPAIDELFIEDGLRLTQMYDETPLCCPARATILSGQHTLHHGITANASGEPDPTTTIATALSDAGYHTFMAGKYVNGRKRYRVPPGWDHVLMYKDKEAETFYLDGEFAPFEGRFGDDVVRETAVGWLREAPLERPVFAYITPKAPHRVGCKGQGKSDKVRKCDYLPQVWEPDQGSPVCADIPPYRPPDYETARTSQKPPWAMPRWKDGWPLTTICGSLLLVDRMVAELRAAQAERDRPAWFIFLSDNGMSWGRKSYPLKHVPTATRLPFYVSGPGVAAGAEDATLLSNVDVASTLVDMGGTVLPIADGESFLPLLQGAAYEGRRTVLEVMPSRASRAYDGWAGLRTPRWRYIRWDDGRRELYDLASDPDELEDLSAREPRRVARLDARLTRMLRDSQR